VIELSESPRCRAPPAHVAGLAALRSRPLTVIDCGAALGIATQAADWRRQRAVVVEHDGHLYGLLVDGADDIVAALDDPRPLGADPGPGWQHAALGRVETEAGAVLLLDIGALIAGSGKTLAA
jgi:purine-binding chemotaxis protein CheW